MSSSKLPQAQVYYELRSPQLVLHLVCQSLPTVPCLPARIRSRRDCLRLFMHWYQRVSASPRSSRSTEPSSYPLTTQMHALALPGSQLRHARRSSSQCWSCVPNPPPPAANLSRASVRTGDPLNPRFVGSHFTYLQRRVAFRCAARNHTLHSACRHAALRDIG